MRRERSEVQPRACQQLPHERVNLDYLAIELIERLGICPIDADQLDQQANPRQRGPQFEPQSSHPRGLLAAVSHGLMTPLSPTALLVELIRVNGAGGRGLGETDLAAV